jgi:hypothetical protein
MHWKKRQGLRSHPKTRFYTLPHHKHACLLRKKCGIVAAKGGGKGKIFMSGALISDKREGETIEEERERLLVKKKQLENRLLEINGPPMSNKNEWKVKKTDVHWDSLLQELV